MKMLIFVKDANDLKQERQMHALNVAMHEIDFRNRNNKTCAEIKISDLGEENVDFVIGELRNANYHCMRGTTTFIGWRTAVRSQVPALLVGWS